MTFVDENRRKLCEFGIPTTKTLDFWKKTLKNALNKLKPNLLLQISGFLYDFTIASLLHDQMSLYLWLYSQSLHHRSCSPPNPSTISMIWYWFKATQNIKRTWVSTSNNTFSIDHFHHIHSKKINIPTTKNFINPILTTTFLCKTRSWRQQKNGSRGNPPKPFTFDRLSASQQLLVMEPWPPGCQNPPVLMGWWDGIFFVSQLS